MGLFSEWRNKAASAFGGRAGGSASRRPDGGTSCYRPIRKRTRDDQPADLQNAQGISYVHTGFTGMNPPADYAPQRYFTENREEQASYGQTGYQQGNTDRDGYYRNMGMQGGNRQDSFFAAPAQGSQRDNISYMPGYAPENNSRPASGHVEHLLTLTGLKSCYEAIECMRNGETLIISTDAIANEGESVRCQDMLAGAAFTLGCQVRTLQGGAIVLIAPENVQILPEQMAQHMEMNAPAFAAAAYAPQVPESAPAPRRERRASANPDWEAARNGQRNNYNPYTGTMPAAAGSYTRFGGYGT